MVGTLELSNLVNIHSRARKLLKFLLALPIKGMVKNKKNVLQISKISTRPASKNNSSGQKN